MRVSRIYVHMKRAGVRKSIRVKEFITKAILDYGIKVDNTHRSLAPSTVFSPLLREIQLESLST
jgi:hypothetical protein